MINATDKCVLSMLMLRFRDSMLLVADYQRKKTTIILGVISMVGMCNLATSLPFYITGVTGLDNV